MANATVTLGASLDGFGAARWHRLAVNLLRGALVFAGVVVLGSYALLAITHIGDRFQVNFCSSIYVTLAAYVNHGLLYPELYDGTHYGGTRYMPLEFVLHAGVARLTGESLVSGKLLTYTLTLGLCVQLWFALRAGGCPRSGAVPTISFLFLTECGYLACTTIRGDLLPVVCQFGALLLLNGQPTRGRAALAGLCCSLALLAKFSALWAPLAITVFLLARHRRLLPYFLGVALVAFLAAISACEYLSAGRMFANFAALSVAGVTLQDACTAPLMLLWKLGRCGIAVAFLVPVLAVELVTAARQRRYTLFHYAAWTCLLNTVVIFTDRAADTNHLLDLVVLAVVLCGCLWGALPALRGTEASLRVVLATAMLWVLFTAWVNTLVFPVLSAVRALQDHRVDPHFSSPPLADLIAAGEPILAEDAIVEVSRGRLPTVMDPYAVARMSKSRPGLIDPLVRRIEAREFDYLVLLQRLDAPTPATDRYRWEDRAFGPAVVGAMRRNYHFHAEREGYFVYARDGGAATQSQKEATR